MTGKIGPEELSRVLSRTGVDQEDVLVGPAYGEDAAVLSIGGERLVVSSDPISLAADRAGTIAVHVAANDVAASGADPRFLQSVVFVPDLSLLEVVTDQLDREATDLGVAIVGGHTEVAEYLPRPLLVLTCMGIADRLTPTSGAEPGDRVLLTKGAAIEATAILATDFVEESGLTEELLARAEAFFSELSVVPEARLLRERANSMHDPTEAGVLGGLYELAHASDVRIDVEREAVGIREPTDALCSAMGIDPLRAFGSGALLATVPSAGVDGALAALSGDGIGASEIGRVSEGGPSLVLDGETITDPPRESTYPLWE
ncbi:AIR synthase family protein [Natronorarus salvus]|uniref:AIR synthase family protein n=1 Tax=Natronorarus salvus TaxID=3117733 RepID=UPI002F26CFF5